MITETDLQFHIPENINHSWAETGYFNIYIPESNIFCWVYYVHRAGVGVTTSYVEIIDKWSDAITDQLYSDVSHFNPIPKDATKFTLPSGLSFRALSLSEYQFNYDAGGIELDLRFNAIMPPYDIHDPEMDPMAAADAQEAAANSGFGTAYSSHFDMSVRARGTLKINGKVHAIDCVSTMDHSWGERWEHKYQSMTWANAHFGEDYVLHAIFHFDQNAPAGQQHDFKHGYALVDGKVRGLKGGSVHAIRSGIWPTYVEMRLVDVDDREHVVRGPMVNHHPWKMYGNASSGLAMAQWWSPDVKGPGYGTYFDTWPTNCVRGA